MPIWAWLVIIWSLFGFKVNLISVAADSATGIRVDDFVVLVAFVALLLKSPKRLFGSVLRFRGFLFFLGIQFASVLVNVSLGNVSQVAWLFPLRSLEYFVYYIFAKEYLNFETLYSVLAFYVAYLAIIMLLQLTGNISLGPDYGARTSGNLGGPWEAGMVGGVLYVYFRTNVKGRRSWFLAGLSVLVVVLSGSRIALVGLAVLELWVSKANWRIVLVLSGALLYFVAGVFEVSVVHRIRELFSADYSAAFEYIERRISLSTLTPQSYNNLAFDLSLPNDLNPFGDASFLIRIYRWLMLISLVFANEVSALIGLGPSFASVAVDGYYVRVLAETGVLGLLAFFAFLRDFRKGYRNAPGVWPIVVFGMVVSLFLDFFVTSKPMVIFWLVVGVASSQRVHRRLE